MPVFHWQLVPIRLSVNVPFSAGMQHDGPGEPIPLTVR